MILQTNVSLTCHFYCVVHLLHFKTIDCIVCVVCKCGIDKLDVHSDIEMYRREFLTFLRADILGGSSRNKPLSNRERPEPSWGGAHSPSQAGAAGAEPRGGLAAWYSSPAATPSSQLTRGAHAQHSCCDSISTHGALSVRGVAHVSPFSSINKTQTSFYCDVFGVWEYSIAMMSLCRWYYDITVILVRRHCYDVGFTKYKLLPLFFVFKNIHSIPKVNSVYIRCRMK